MILLSFVSLLLFDRLSQGVNPNPPPSSLFRNEKTIQNSSFIILFLSCPCFSICPNIQPFFFDFTAVFAVPCFSFCPNIQPFFLILRRYLQRRIYCYSESGINTLMYFSLIVLSPLK